MAQDFESFIPSEQSEGFDAAAFEKFKEQIKKSAQAAAKDQKREQQQKKKEQNLVAILLQLMKHQQKQGLLYLISQLLAENIPTLFVLAVASLGHEEVRREAGFDGSNSDENLTLQQKMPPEMKREVNLWAAGLYQAGSEDAAALLEKGLNAQGAIKQILVECAAHAVKNYFEELGELQTLSYEEYFELSKALMKNLFVALKKTTAKSAAV